MTATVRQATPWFLAFFSPHEVQPFEALPPRKGTGCNKKQQLKGLVVLSERMFPAGAPIVQRLGRVSAENAPIQALNRRLCTPRVRIKRPAAKAQPVFRCLWNSMPKH